MEQTKLELIKKARRILINVATNRKTITYSELASKLELPTSGNALGQALSPILYNILRWSQCRGMPPLTAVVVNKSGLNKGYPGQGFWNALFETKFSVEDMAAWFTSILKSVHDYWSVELENQQPFHHQSGWTVYQNHLDNFGGLTVANFSIGVSYTLKRNEVTMTKIRRISHQ